MEVLRWKTRLAVLWVIKAMGFSAYNLTLLLQPGNIKDIIAGSLWGVPVNQSTQLIMTFFWWIPWVMAWLALTLKNRANKWTNFIMGLFFVVALIGGLSMDIAYGSIALIVNYFVGMAVSLLIVWYAWKWPTGQEYPAA